MKNQAQLKPIHRRLMANRKMEQGCREAGFVPSTPKASTIAKRALIAERAGKQAPPIPSGLLRWLMGRVPGMLAV